MRPWIDVPPAGNDDVHYNSLQRVAITQWQEEGGAYRDAQVAS